MASLSELHGLHQKAELRHKVAAAAMIKAHALLSGTPTTAQVEWARDALQNPDAVASLLLRYVLADNAGATAAQIENANDAAIQNAVNAAVDALAV